MLKYDKMMFVLVVLLIAALGGIFFFSSQDAETSTEVSSPVGEAFGRLLHDDFEQWDEAEKAAYVISVDNNVRKGGHLLEFAVLGFLMMMTVWFVLRQRKDNAGCGRRALWISIALTSAYGLGDEIHQIFVPGRAFQVSDILADICGASLGALAGWLLVRRAVGRRK